MDYRKLAKILKKILYFLIVICFFLMFLAFSGEKLQIFIVSLSFIFLFYFLSKIVDSIIWKKPFAQDNAKYFRYIGYLLLFNALFDFIINIHNFSGIKIFSFEPLFTLHLSFFILLTFGLLSLILSEVFKQAHQVKKENELTI